ncbi:MAG TPA: OmpA family protein [Methylocystis sp.]|nr:OmpA family protein [Methylocystis sp.]
MQHPKKWWIGLPILAGLVYFAAQSLSRDIEIALSEGAAAALAEVGKGAIDSPGVSVAGRDVIVTGRKLSPDGFAEALRALSAVPGVRVAIDGSTLPDTISPYELTLTRADRRVTVEGHFPSTGAREALRKELNKLGLEVEDHSSYGLGAPLAFGEFIHFAAGRVAQLGEGVVSLQNNAVSIKGAAAPDADFEKLVSAANAPPPGGKVASVMIEPYRVKPFVWSAERQGRVIQLEGYAPDVATRERIAARAKSIIDGEEVRDLTRIALGAPTGDFAGAAETALAQLRALASGKAALTDNALRIEGEGRPNVSAAGLAAETKRNLPQGFALAALAVADGPASPYLFSASAREGGLLLSGHAPDDAALREIAAIAAGEFGKLAVTDALTTAKGAPPEFLRAASAGLKALARLASGGLAMSDATLSLAGTAAQAELGAIEADLRRDLPGNFVATIQISPPVSAAQAPSVAPAPTALESPVAKVVELQRALDAQLDKTPIQFVADKSELSPENEAALRGLAAILRRAGDQAVEIVGHAPEPNIEELRRTIAKRRAQAVVARLIELGVESERLSPNGAAPLNEAPGAPLIEAKVKSN